MKTIIKSSAVLLVLGLLSFGAFAADEPAANNNVQHVGATVNYESNTVAVDINIHIPTAGDAVVLIYDPNGNVVVNNRFTSKSTDIQKSYLMTDMKEGRYTIKVAAKDGVVKKVVDLKNGDNAAQYYSF